MRSKAQWASEYAWTERGWSPSEREAFAAAIQADALEAAAAAVDAIGEDWDGHAYAIRKLKPEAGK